MSEKKLWAALSAAAEFIDLSPDSVLRRAVEFRGDPDNIHLHLCPEGKVRYKKLKLGQNTRQERRYYVPDLTRWLN